MLAHKVAIVTGGGTGIGKAISANLVKNGAAARRCCNSANGNLAIFLTTDSPSKAKQPP